MRALVFVNIIREVAYAELTSLVVIIHTLARSHAEVVELDLLVVYLMIDIVVIVML